MREDAELLGAWQAGDASAGNELVVRHFASVSRFFRNKLGDDVQDIIQRTFLDCVAKRDAIRDTPGFRPFLFAIAHRRLVDELRRRGRRPTFDPASESIAALDMSPSHAMTADERERLLQRALCLLPLEQQVALELFYWERMRGKEIAEVLGVSAHTVRSRIARAKEALRTKLIEVAENSAVGHETAEGLETWARRVGDLQLGATPTPGSTDDA